MTDHKPDHVLSVPPGFIEEAKRMSTTEVVLLHEMKQTTPKEDAAFIKILEEELKCRALSS